MELRALKDYYSGAAVIYAGHNTIGHPLDDNCKKTLLELHPDSWVEIDPKEEEARLIALSKTIPAKEKSKGFPNGLAADVLDGSEDDGKDVDSIENQEDKTEVTTQEKKAKTKKK